MVYSCAFLRLYQYSRCRDPNHIFKISEKMLWIWSGIWAHRGRSLGSPSGMCINKNAVACSHWATTIFFLPPAHEVAGRYCFHRCLSVTLSPRWGGWRVGWWILTPWGGYSLPQSRYPPRLPAYMDLGYYGMWMTSRYYASYRSVFGYSVIMNRAHGVILSPGMAAAPIPDDKKWIA